MAAIDRRLDAVAGEHGARLLFAVESGSRAWGFPSPDSDYDCRFVYLRPAEHYLRLRQPRDVIEFPIKGELDVNGWDLRKALTLALSGNAVIAEWAASPIRYADPEGCQGDLAARLRAIVDPRLAARHYAGLAAAHRARFDYAGEVPLKKLFYALRPVFTLIHMRDRGYRDLPPMHLPTVLAGIDLAADVRAAVEDLLAAKAVTRELGRGVAPEPIRRALFDGFALADEAMRLPPDAAGAATRTEAADVAFVDALRRFSPGQGLV